MNQVFHYLTLSSDVLISFFLALRTMVTQGRGDICTWPVSNGQITSVMLLPRESCCALKQLTDRFDH